LRDDLRLLPAAPSPGGEPAWTIHDPVRQRFFRIGVAAFEAVARWNLGSSAAVASSIAAETTLRPTTEDIQGLRDTLIGAGLTCVDDVARLVRAARAREVSWWTWLLHNYLFFRVPLARPDAFLARTLWLVRPLFGKTWRRLVFVAGPIGIALVSRQWDTFLATFTAFDTWEGIAWSGVTLVLAKILHELGHGYAAKRHGCRVPTMGVAFLVMWPVLYTDTTDTWRLVSRRARLEVAGAGILTELTLAVLATLAWSFLPDGPARAAAFMTATVTWVSTLAINLSPFMRFDGYYLLSDGLDIANLHERSFAVTRRRLREMLFGVPLPAEESFPRTTERLLMIIAVATWIYRLVLFLGIAYLVYEAVFKALGVLLFSVEIGWFVLRPIVGEIMAWWRLRRVFRLNLNLVLTSLAAAGIVVGLVVPITTTVPMPAAWRAATFVETRAPVPARLVRVETADGRAVAEGETLFVLEAPELDSRSRSVETRIAYLRARVARARASGEGMDQVAVAEEELGGAVAERRELEANRARLTITAPFAGTARDVEEDLVPGRWLSPITPLARIVAADEGTMIAYVAEADLDRVRPGAAARFHPDDPFGETIPARVVFVDRVNAATLDIPALAATNGGTLPVHPPSGDPRERNATIPADAVYRVVLTPEPGCGRPPRLVRGVVRIEAEPRAIATRIWVTAFGVVLRESGF